MKNSAPRIPLGGSTILVFVVVSFVSLAFLILSGGNIVAAFVPTIALSAGVLLFSLPLRISVLAFFAVALLFHNPAALPMAGKWKGPLYTLGPILYDNLNSITGVGALKFNLIQLVTLLFLFIATVRTLLRSNIDQQLTVRAVRVQQIASIVSLTAAVFFIAWGILRGGNKQLIPLQAKAFIFTPLFTILFMRAFKSEKIFRLAGKLLVGIAVIRVLEGTYFYYAIAARQGMFVEYVMTHNDTVLFTVTISILVLNYLEYRDRKSLRNLLICGGIIMWGIIINDRRAAFVSVAACIFFMYFFIAPTLRKQINRLILISLPVLILYVGIGMKSESKIFAPVHAFTSVADTKDASNQSRDIENLNLLYSVSLTPVIGTGFGFPYSEITPAVPLPYDFYKYLAHNQILWVAYLTGAVGFFLLWLPLSLGCFYAFRCHKYATSPTQRITALSTVCIVIAYMMQTFADMGCSGTVTNVILGSSLAMVANMANKLNAA
jgi:hypothetical protein